MRRGLTEGERRIRPEEFAGIWRRRVIPSRLGRTPLVNCGSEIAEEVVVVSR